MDFCPSVLRIEKEEERPRRGSTWLAIWLRLFYNDSFTLVNIGWGGDCCSKKVGLLLVSPIAMALAKIGQCEPTIPFRSILKYLITVHVFLPIFHSHMYWASITTCPPLPTIWMGVFHYVDLIDAVRLLDTLEYYSFWNQMRHFWGTIFQYCAFQRSS